MSYVVAVEWKRAVALIATVLVAVGIAWAPSALAQDEEPAEQALARVFSGAGQDQERIPNVGITVIDAEGAEIGSALTDDNGEALIDLPGPGEYTIQMDATTLPEGLTPRNETTERTQTVQPGRQANALFPLDGEGTGGAGGGAFANKLSRVPQLFVDGIKLGFIIAISAIGLSLIFGVTGLVNFAHGELVTLGAVVAFFINASPAGPGVHLVFAGVVAIIIGGIFGGGLESAVWAPLRSRGVGLIAMLVISIGLSFIIRNVILIAYGGDTRPFTNYNIQEQISLFGIRIVPRDLGIIVISTVVLVGIGLMLQRTKIGKAMRAVSDNRDLAESSGINVNRVIQFVWVLGGGLSALGGVLLGSTEQVNVNMGFNLLLLMFAGVILGGIGTAYGAMLGSLVVGVISQVSTAFFSVQLKFVWALLILILVLLVKPQGILGRAERFG
ncbi:ABC transporter permease subunit [Euzebya tangerina]|uniref:ABC transporter permease subunit n=1 Tax=Euzebya tangerina TaxID=591198 RepID=UPI0013C34DF1|nr:branched-chain amino acid ABC transporter permease [Euzebya tangerina]